MGVAVSAHPKKVSNPRYVGEHFFSRNPTSLKGP